MLSIGPVLLGLCLPVSEKDIQIAFCLQANSDPFLLTHWDVVYSLIEKWHKLLFLNKLFNIKAAFGLTMHSISRFQLI